MCGVKNVSRFGHMQRKQQQTEPQPRLEAVDTRSAAHLLHAHGSSPKARLATLQRSLAAPHSRVRHMGQMRVPCASTSLMHEPQKWWPQAVMVRVVRLSKQMGQLRRAMDGREAGTCEQGDVMQT
jgi:hypothetical protein